MKNLYIYAALASSVVTSHAAVRYDTPLHSAVRAGDYKLTEGYAKLMPALVDREAEHGLRAIHIAILRGDLECLGLLIDFDADVNLQDDHKQTALHYAAIAGNREAVKMLLRARAKKTLEDTQGYTPFARAISAGHLKLASLLKL